MNGISEFVFLSTLSFIFGITQKLADRHHEHGLNFFPNAGNEIWHQPNVLHFG